MAKKPTYHIIDTEERFQKFYEIFSKQPRFAYDTETTGLNFYKDKIICFTFAFDWHRAWFIPVRKREIFTNDLVDFWDNQEGIINALLHILSDTKKDITAHNAKFDYQMVKTNYGITVPIAADSMIYAKLVNELLPVRLSFRHRLYDDLKGYDEELETLVDENNVTDYSTIPMDILAKYAAFDALATFRLTITYINLMKKIKAEINEKNKS